MDASDLRGAIGGVVLESAYLERVLRAAFSALIGSKYAAVIASRLTLQSGSSSHEVTVAAKTVSELGELADRIGRAADQVAAAVLVALGPASLLIEDQLRQELGHDVSSDHGN